MAELWTVSLSMRSPGTNFTKDLPWMSAVASNYFGMQMDELKIVLPKVKEGKVEIGTPIILGEVILPKQFGQKIGAGLSRDKRADSIFVSPRCRSVPPFRF